MFRHLEESLDDWLEEELENFAEDDYIVFDCPGISLPITFVLLFVANFLVYFLYLKPTQLIIRF